MLYLFSTVMRLKSFCSGSMFVMLIKGLKCIALSGNQYSHVGCLEIGVNFGPLHKLGCVQNALLSRVLAPMAACARKQKYFAYNNLIWGVLPQSSISHKMHSLKRWENRKTYSRDNTVS